MAHGRDCRGALQNQNPCRHPTAQTGSLCPHWLTSLPGPLWVGLGQGESQAFLPIQPAPQPITERLKLCMWGFLGQLPPCWSLALITPPRAPHPPNPAPSFYAPWSSLGGEQKGTRGILWDTLSSPASPWVPSHFSDGAFSIPQLQISPEPPRPLLRCRNCHGFIIP